MGFRPEPTIYSLTFDGTPLEGLHVRIGCCTLREFNTMTNFEATTTKEAEDQNQRVEALFFSYLKEWDLENPADGEPTPMTPDGLSVHEPGLIRMLVSAWQVAMVSVPVPLQKQSASGSSLEELSLGLANSSESPQSLNTQVQ